MLIRTNDTVKILTGDDAGSRGRVLAVNRATGKVVVEGVNRVYKHVRRSQRNQQGGRLSKEMPVFASNVLVVCEKCQAASRLGVRFLDDGVKERYCKKCGAGNGPIGTQKARRVKA